MKQKRNDFGQSLVEWALILPIFILLLLGMVEIGQIYSKQHLVNQIAKEISRTASIGESTEHIRLKSIDISKTIFDAQSATVTQQTNGTKITVIDSKGKSLDITFEPSLANRKKGTTIKIRVLYTYTPITPFLNLTNFSIKTQYSTLVEVTPSTN